MRAVKAEFPITDDARLSRWESWAEIPLTVAAILFLIAFAMPIMWWPGTPAMVALGCEVVVWVTWAFFALDYLVRLILSPNRRQFVRRKWFDLLIIALPMLRPLRLLRLVTVLSLVNRKASSNLRGRVVAYVAGGSILLLFIGALAVVDAERGNPEANLTSIGDALWWAATTMTTVGYGDHYPVTSIGRGVAIGLMVCGIAVLGTVTASLASWIVERVSETQSGTNDLADEVRALRQQVARLEELNRMAPEPRPPLPLGVDQEPPIRTTAVGQGALDPTKPPR